MPKRAAILTSITLFALAIWVAVLFTANINAVSAQNGIQSWQQEKKLPDAGELESALSDISRAIKLDPKNPDYLSSKAEITRYAALVQDARTDAYEKTSRDALEQYRALTKRRPAWAPYWSGIVSIKFDLWEFDAEMYQAIQNAARLGPWFKANQFTILNAGFTGWPFIDEPTRKIVEETLDRAMQIQPKETIQLAILQNFDDRLIPYLEKNEAIKNYYKKELKMLKKQ